MFENNYFHSLCFGSDKMLQTFEKIINDKKILSLKKSGVNYEGKRLNKEDEICLSRKNKFSYFYESSYDAYVRYHLSFILKNEIDAYKAPLIPKTKLFFNDIENFCDTGTTNYCDEYRVKDEISLNDVVGISIPFSSIINLPSSYNYFIYYNTCDGIRRCYSTREEREENIIIIYNRLIEIMKKNDIIIPIYDIFSNREIKNSDEIVKIKRKSI